MCRTKVKALVTLSNSVNSTLNHSIESFLLIKSMEGHTISKVQFLIKTITSISPNHLFSHQPPSTPSSSSILSSSSPHQPPASLLQVVVSSAKPGPLGLENGSLPFDLNYTFMGVDTGNGQSPMHS